MKHLNSIEGFNWVSTGNNSENMGKVSICGESFWLRECKKQADGIWYGIVDNSPLFTEVHGLKLNDNVTFTIDV
jgi:hypothetical protein